ncbi:unnamed protein product [Periconia digitata]|uniref:Uncharacterized protein n=1 Tax=Periconia digitata TaxID=1303443 RepID=A0A9W4ULE1_9PLEO|nr:unnamed protein product [Periconia digitata]
MHWNPICVQEKSSRESHSITRYTIQPNYCLRHKFKFDYYCLWLSTTHPPSPMTESLHISYTSQILVLLGTMIRLEPKKLVMRETIDNILLDLCSTI